MALRAKFDQFLPHLDERRRRFYLASEAIELGHGGITLVAAASGSSAATIARGIAELSGRPLPAGRIRAPGAGRKPVTVTDPGLLPALEALIEPHTRGDPVSPLRWTTLSLRSLAAELTTRGHPVSAATVGRLLHALGYSLQGTAKTTEGTSHPDRDAQFSHINATATAFLEDNQPVISVDTKAKEWLGNRDRPGRIWRPGKTPIRVDCHTFIASDQPVVIPYGIYDIARNTGWVNVGTDHDTAEFAVESIRRWWQQRGRGDHPDAGRLLITADCGGSNDPRRWTWKKHLAAFALEGSVRSVECEARPREESAEDALLVLHRLEPLAEQGLQLAEGAGGQVGQAPLDVHPQASPGSGKARPCRDRSARRACGRARSSRSSARSVRTGHGRPPPASGDGS